MDFNCERRYLMKLSDKFEIKLFILLLLDGIGVPLEFEVINDIVLRDGVVTYFDFADAFGDLCDNGLIEYTEQPDGSGKTYSVTPKGSRHNGRAGYQAVRSDQRKGDTQRTACDGVQTERRQHQCIRTTDR